MKLKFLGHSCFQLEVSGKYIVFDPFIRGNPLAAEAGIDIDQVEADYILVSHGHDDHTGDLVYLAEKTKAHVVCGWELYRWLTRQGYTNAHSMNVGGKKEFEFGWLRVVYAAHSSSLADGTYGGLALGFVITAEGKQLYYSGDTGLTVEMKLLGEMNKLDVALLPIGDNYTMGYEDAAIAARFINCNRIIGMHYDTFEGIKTDQDAAKSHFIKEGRELMLMRIGETIDL